MSTWSPTAEGFRTIFRSPALSLAEISWRWSFAAAAWFVCMFGVFEYLNTLPVSNRDLVLLNTGMPGLALRALAHIVQGSGLRLLLAIVISTAGAAILWIAIASLGRAATLPSLIESIRTRARALAGASAEGSENVSEADRSSYPLRSLAGLHFLRVLLFGLAAFAGMGAALAAGSLSSTDDPHPALAFFVFLMLALFIALAIVVCNWFLSLATLFVVRDGESSFGAISRAANLCRDRLGAVLAVGAWFGLAHLTFFVIATSVVGLPLAFLGIVPPGVVLLGVLFVTLLYLAIVDALYIGRMAGYAAILEAPQFPSVVAVGSSIPVPALASYSAPLPENTGTMVDQDELILSDTPKEPPSSVDQDELILSDQPSAASEDVPPR